MTSEVSDEDYCQRETWTAPYLVYPISITMLGGLQLLLLIRSLYFECVASKSVSKVRKSIRYSYIALIISGLYWYTIDVLRFVIDPFTFIIQNNEILCGLVAYSPKIIAFVFYFLYSHQLFQRLKLSFKGSFIEVSPPLNYILSVCVYIPAVILLPLFLVYSPLHCIYLWNPRDFVYWNIANNNFSFCDVQMEGQVNIISSCGIGWAMSVNILLGAIFTLKLRKMLMLRKSVDFDEHSFKLKSIMVKNTLLTIVAVISTITNWFAWMVIMTPFALGPTFLYLDVTLNSLLMGLMFNRNHRYYNRLCSCCIKISHIIIDYSENRSSSVINMDEKSDKNTVQMSIELSSKPKAVIKVNSQTVTDKEDESISNNYDDIDIDKLEQIIDDNEYFKDDY